MFTLPPDLVPFRTADGSYTLHSPFLVEQYHSKHGAVQESMHVYIRSGLAAIGKEHIDILEVGLGTGLNFLLAWIRCLEGKCTASYTALEPNRLSSDVLGTLRHCDDLAWPGLHEPFLERMTGDPGTWQPEEGGMTFRLLETPVQEIVMDDAFDVVFFDAFGPRTQPDMWTVEVFQRLFRALRKGGVLTTYCAKGEVRRSMKAAGFHVERLKGPPQKAHMLRAIKP
jgi:tRNA U34 5-methylaminomethyl-2-thiouridine-forming methyltransferase MnmC